MGELARGVHPNDYFQKSYRKYGSSQFTWAIIEETKPQYRKAIEQTYENYYKQYKGTYSPLKYVELTDNLRGKARPESEIEKQRASLIGYKPTVVTQQKISATKDRFKKPVDQVDLTTGLVIHTWSSLCETQREGGFNLTCVRNAAEGIVNTHKGFGWIFSNPEHQVHKPKPKHVNRNHRPIEQVSDLGVVGFYLKMADVVNMGFIPECVSAAVRRGNKYKGYTWRYATASTEPIKPIRQIELSSGKVIKIWENLDIARQMGFDPTLIQHAAMGRHAQHKGYGWEFIDAEQGSALARWRKTQRKLRFVDQICRETGLVLQTWPSLAAAREAGYRQDQIRYVSSGKAEHYKGFFWCVRDRDDFDVGY